MSDLVGYQFFFLSRDGLLIVKDRKLHLDVFQITMILGNNCARFLLSAHYLLCCFLSRWLCNHSQGKFTKHFGRLLFVQELLMTSFDDFTKLVHNLWEDSCKKIAVPIHRYVLFSFPLYP